MDEELWNGLNVRPPVLRFDRQSILANLDQSQEAPPALSMALPKKPLPEDLPREQGWQQWVVTIALFSEYGYDGYTFRPPFLPDLNQWYSRQTVFLPWSLRVEGDGVGIIRRVHDETAALRALRIPDLIHRILQRAGIESNPSRPGRIAHRIIRQMGGLEGCRVFKIPGVRKLIASKDARQGIPRSRAVEIIRDVDPDTRTPTFTRHETLFIEPREKPKLEPHAVFDYLLKKEIFRPGLSFLCPNCTLDFWVEVGSFTETCRCEYCGHQFLIAPHLRHRGDWRFRLTGLFGREDNQEGAIPVVLTLLQLLRLQHGEGNVLYDTAVELRGPGLKCEVDFVFLERDNNGATRVLLGECKAGGRIEEVDLANMVVARRLLEGSGLESYLLFSKTAALFEEVELERFRAMTADRVPAILFTAKELEPYHPYWELGDNVRLPHKYPFSLEEIANNSAFLYLQRGTGDPPV